MSTRSNILIKSGSTNIWLYRHCDGYLSETGYNLASTLTHCNGFKSFLDNLLNQKYEATMYRSQQPIYEFTTEEHGDIEYLYSFEFDRSMPKNVRVIVESCASWEDRKTLIDTEFSITPQNVEKHLKLIIKEHTKALNRSLKVA
tara:strand:- start:232 stop:663 length:432 start_codon:yes stop_codon:yes gene_type:complete